jgi:hypothetical protein
MGDVGPVTDARPGAGGGLDVGEYCRHVEAHLARVNAGEIIRISGAGFELVRGWALEGIPLSVVRHAISLKAERHQAGRSTRPLRIEFCAADVRAVYATWRRAVGMTAGGTDGTDEAAPADEPRRGSLARHLQRAIDRLSRSVSRVDLEPAIRVVLDRGLQEVAALAERARGARGAARDAAVADLAAIDGRLMAEARRAVGPNVLDQLAADASADLAAYRNRLTPEIWQRSVDLAVNRLLRERLGLPVLDL